MLETEIALIVGAILAATMARNNKTMARNNKTPHGGKATKTKEHKGQNGRPGPHGGSTMARKSKERQQPKKSEGEPCFSCRGEGRIWDHVCPSCKGTGRKPSYDADRPALT